MSRLPGSQRVLTDIIEWYAHSTLLETSTDAEIQFAAEQIQNLSAIAFPQPLAKAGRIWNRLLLTLLVQNVCGRKIFGDDSDALFNLNPDGWHDIILQLEACRSSLIKANSNSFPPEGYDKEDDDLKELPMFNEVYRDVYDLLQCHLAVSQFRNSLETAQPDDFHSHLDIFTNSLPMAFATGALVDFVRIDVLSSPKRNTNLCTKTRKHFNRLMQTTSQPYSYDTVQNKVKTLARTWNESILGIPTLVKLGYGGIHETVTGDDTKTVSSWGMDEQEEYHTADEMDAEDSTEEMFTDDDDDEHRANEGAMPLREFRPLQIRPRQTWRESFEMIDGLQEINAEGKAKDESADPARLTGTDSDYTIDYTTPRIEMQAKFKLGIRRRLRQAKLRKLLEGSDDDEPTQPRPTHKSRPQQPTEDMANGSDSAATRVAIDGASINASKDASNTCREESLDENLPPYLKEKGDFRLPTYAEHKERTSLSPGALNDVVIMPRKKRRRFFFHTIHQREDNQMQAPEVM
jgi:hypothetical protein